MAFINNAILGANKALGRIEALAGQAKSYYAHPRMLGARKLAGDLARSGLNTMNAARNPMLIGAGVGAAAGAGYNYATDRRASAGSMLRAGLRGGAVGAGAGLGYYGVRAAGGPRALMQSARSRMTNLGGRMTKGWAGMVAKAEAGGFKY